MGKPGRSDRPLVRILGAVKPAFGQSKVLQSVSLKDRAGLGAHVHLLGLPLVPFELSALHLRRLGVAQALGHPAHERGREGIRNMPGASRRRVPGGAVVGRGQALGGQAAPAILRPDTEGRICHHPAAHRAVDAAVPLCRGLLRRLRWQRPRLGDPHRAPPRRPAGRLGAERHPRRRPVPGLMVGAPRPDSRVRHLHPAVQARPHSGLSHLIRDAVVGTDGRAAHADGPGDGGDLRGCKAPRLQPQGAAGRLRLRRLRPLHR